MTHPPPPPHARLVTVFGSVLYVDTASGELRHGPIDGSPANAVLAADSDSPRPPHQGWLMHRADGVSAQIRCSADRCTILSRSHREGGSAAPTRLEVIPLERGLIALRAGGLFLTAIPDGTVRLSAPICSTWELFLASEDWCSDPATAGDWSVGANAAQFDRQAIRQFIVHPTIRARANTKPKARKILIYGYTGWSHGRVYYDLCKHLHRRGYILDILDWRAAHTDYIAELVAYYDFFMTALDGVHDLVVSYSVPYERIIAISHHEFDIRMLIEQEGIEVFDKFANYGVVSDFLYCASMTRGVRRAPMVAPVGITYADFHAEISERLTTVGYASSMAVETYGVEWKRGALAEAAVSDAGLAFKVAGSTGNQISFHDMPEFYRSVDAVVTSSMSEAAQLPVMEAAAAGRLVIGTPVGHFPLRAYQGGEIIAPVAAEKFEAFTADTLRYYKDDPAAYVDKCRAIQEAAKQFDWRYAIADWVELIEKASSQSDLAATRDARPEQEGAGNPQIHSTPPVAPDPSRQPSEGRQPRDVTIFFPLTDDVYVDDFLLSIHNQSYDKSRIHLFAGTTKLGTKGKDALNQFVGQHGSEYKVIIISQMSLPELKKQAIGHCISNNTDYFMIEENIIIHPETLRRLYDINLQVVSPMLVFDGVYSNFYAHVDDRGYFKRGDDYFKILGRELCGAINVPVVNACYLVRNECMKYVEYDDSSGRPEYVVFSDTLRKRGISQYIDNTFNHGILLNFTNKTPQEIEDNVAINNKNFYLGISTRHKRGIICDADWLSSYVIGEHLYLMRLLQDHHDFHILNCNKLGMRNADLLDDLNSYDVLLTAYHVFSKMPLDRVTAYKIYKIDDMENDAEYTKIVNFNINHSDMIISPYAYVFDKFYKHDNVVWVPYSCALESFEKWQTIEFNETPKNKIFQSGHLASTYPFRQYVASLNNESIEKMPHQGWQRRIDSDREQIIGLKYYRRLNEYLCCFTDALTFRYIVCKNFEIAATGSLLLTDKIVETEMNELGFVDHETCIFCDKETFLQKVDWILDPLNRQEVDAIRRAGMNLVRERHMTRHRAAQIAMLAERSTCVSGHPTP